jgi:hypothetical protein
MMKYMARNEELINNLSGDFSEFTNGYKCFY